MNPRHPAPAQSPEPLKQRLHKVLLGTDLACHQQALKKLAGELNTDVLSCAAALLALLEPLPTKPSLLSGVTAPKMIRYRLDIGSEHQLTPELLKKVLVDESGVDKNNILNINIRDAYTLIDLPDAMPPDIFQHLKTVEINHQALAIKRIKPRNKKRAGPYRRRSKPIPGKTSSGE